MFSLRCNLVSSIKMLVPFRHRILEHRLISFWNDLQIYSIFLWLTTFFFLEVVIKVFDNFWEPDSLISKLIVNCLLMFHFVYCNICDLKNINGACFYTCSVLALSIPKMYFWPAKTRKNPKLPKMLTCHWIGAQMWFRHKWKNLVTASLLLHCTDVLWLRPLLERVFFNCVPGFRLNFYRIVLWRKRLQLDSKSDSTMNGLILGFFVGKLLPSSTSYLHGLKNAWILQLLFFFDDIIFFDV